ncbi:tudor domain-containing protein 15 [Oncorhynchus masou masou]|uniref:tudor domain-containing protein 15 n=1 Tax=Oncorhynchus masou masou TaxID=90313 RepID=UPI003183E049
MAFPCALSCLNGQDKAVKIQQLTCFKKGLLGGVLDVEINGFDKEQNLYSVTVLSAEDYAAVEAGPIQDVPGQRECDFVLESEPAFPLNGYLYYETAIIQAMDNSVIVEEMQEDSVFEGYVEHVLNPGAFWLRTQKRNKDFEEMMENMAKHFSQVQLDEEILENPEPGALCCAMYELDMHYYRAMVTDTLDNGAEVFFIDFGNTEKVPRMCIKQIPDKFAIEPAFALNCSLVNVMPFDDVWTISATDYFRRAVSSKTLLVHVVHIRKDLYVVDLYERENNSSQRASKSITELLTTTNHAEFWKYTPSAPVIPKSEMEKKMMKPKTDFWCQLESKIPNLEDMMEAIQRHKHDICEHQDSNQLQSTTFGPSMEAVKDMAIPSQDIRAGQTESGTLLSVLENGDLYLRLHSTTEQFTVLENLIVEHLSKCKVMSEKNVKEGLQCLAKSTKDDQWHRAVVRHASIDQGKCVVFLVDHGTAEDVPMGCIKDLCNDIKQTPVQAVLCKWNSPGLPISDAYEILKKTLKQMVGKDVKLMFVSYSEADNLWMVEIMINGLFLVQQMKTATSEFTEERPIPTKTQTVTPKEKNSNLDNSPQRFFLSPVNMDLGYSGFAAAVTTPSEFYIVLEDLLLIMNNVSTILEDLPKELLPLHEEHLIPGSCCLVRSDRKNKWCRAEIVHSDSTVVVINLVDYGHCVDMPYKDWSELRRLPDQLTRLPKVTYPCTLRGVKSVEGQWTDEAVVFFQECICKKNLQIYFRQYISEAHWEVDIVADGVHVAKDLVDAGHAEYIDIMLGLRFQEQRPIRAPEQKLGMSRAERTSKVELEMTPPRTNKFLRRLNEERELDGHTSSEAAFHGQGFEKASEKTASATEYPDGQGAEMMTHCSTMTGTRHSDEGLLSDTASLQPRVRYQAVSEQAVTGRPMRTCTIGLASAGFSLPHRTSATSCGGPGTCKLTFVTSWTFSIVADFCGQMLTDGYQYA